MSDAYCYLCGAYAYSYEHQGVAYYRFYDPVEKKWVSEPICILCFTKLKGPTP